MWDERYGKLSATNAPTFVKIGVQVTGISAIRSQGYKSNNSFTCKDESALL